jgi:hypothetical protein
MLTSKGDLTPLDGNGLVAVCSWCKRFRDPYGEWIDPGMFLFKHFEEKFTHTICDECSNLYFPDFSRGIIESHQQVAT